MRQFFPNLHFTSQAGSGTLENRSEIQSFLERILKNAFGHWIEKQLGTWQKKRVRQDSFVFVRENELSFHPDSKQQTLLKDFFK